MSEEEDRKPKVTKDDPCKCKNVKGGDSTVINYNMFWGDGIVIHDPKIGGCGKFIRYFDRD